MHAEERGWTTYRVAKNAGIPQSSMTTWYSKQINPPLDAIEKMCIAFDISLSDFFYEKRKISRRPILRRSGSRPE